MQTQLPVSQDWFQQEQPKIGKRLPGKRGQKKSDKKMENRSYNHITVLS